MVSPAVSFDLSRMSVVIAENSSAHCKVAAQPLIDRWIQGRRQVKQSGVDSVGGCGEGVLSQDGGYRVWVYNLKLNQ